LQIEDGTPRTGAFGVSGYLAWHIFLLVFAMLKNKAFFVPRKSFLEAGTIKKHCMGGQLEKKRFSH